VRLKQAAGPDDHDDDDDDFGLSNDSFWCYDCTGCSKNVF
jgi:hypothetical protein